MYGENPEKCIGKILINRRSKITEKKKNSGKIDEKNYQ